MAILSNIAISGKLLSFSYLLYVGSEIPNCSAIVTVVNLEDEIELYTGAGGALEGCRKIGGVDTSCLWENHACLSSQAYCCD